MARGQAVAVSYAGRPASERGWNGAPYVAVAMLLVIAVRLHEFVPYAHVVQPALLATFGGLGLLWLRSSYVTRRAVTRHTLVRLVAGYWAIMIVTIPFALWPGLAAETVIAFIPAVALTIAILVCAPTDRAMAVLQMGLIAGVAAFAVYAKLFGRVSWEGRLSPGGGMYDSNDMAAMIAMTIPFAIATALRRRGVQRVVIAGACAVLVAVLLASGSRGGLLGMTGGGALMALGMRGRRRIVALAMLGLILGGMWTFSSSFRGRLLSLTHLETDYNTFDDYGRKEVWKRGRQYIRDNPVLGVGAGNFPIAEGNYFGVLYSGVRGAKWSNAHNSYIQAYAELGAVGGTLFLAILLYGVRRAFRLWRGVRVRDGTLIHRPELLASLGAFLVSGTFLSHAYYMPMVATLALIALADRQLAARQAVTSAIFPADGALPVMSKRALATRGSLGARFRGGLA